MQLTGAPAQLVLPWGNGDSSKTNPIPVPSQQGVTPGAASWTDGFPPLCATPVTSGGVPPSKADMNGGLYQMSAVDVWTSAGGGFVYNSAFATAIGGYPQGARVLQLTGNGYWLNLFDNNTSNPDTGGSGWIPDHAYAAVYASGQQTLSGPESKIIFDSVEVNERGMWDTVNHRVNALWGGGYRFSGSVYLPSPGAQLLAIDVYKNGVLFKRGAQFPQVSNVALSYQFDVLTQLQVGDYLEAFMSVPTTPIVAGPASGSSEAYVYAQVQYVGA